MAGSCYLTGKLQRTFSGLLAMKLIAMIKLDVFHAAESPHKVEVPVATAKLSVRDVMKAMGLLLLYNVLYKAVFNCSELFC